MDRKLAAILFSDIAGFTKLTAGDEEKAFDLINQQRKLFKPIVAQFDGEWLKEIGDGLLLLFSSSKKAINCAIAIQKKALNIDNLDIRIGLHQGDVIISNDDVLGDDVNIASRIEPISAVGGIAVSEKVVMDLMSSPEYTFKYLGVPELKGVKQNVKVFSLSSHSMPLPKAGFLLKKESTKAKNSSTIISIIGTIIFSLIIFFSYPHLSVLFYIDRYNILKIDDIVIKTKIIDKEKSFIKALKYGIEKNILDMGEINLINLNQSKASFLMKTSNYLLLSTKINEDKENIDVSFILNKPDGTIYDQYNKQYISGDIENIIDNLIDFIPIWITNSILKDKNMVVKEYETGINKMNYPIKYYELLSYLKSDDYNEIKNVIIKLDELDITDNSNWIDIMIAEAYTRGYIHNGSKSFLNNALEHIERFDFSNPDDIAYAFYVMSLINFSQDRIDEALIDIKQAIKNNQSEKRYKEFHHTVRSIKLKRMTLNE